MKSIQNNSSKELNHTILQYKLSRNNQLHFIENELKSKLFQLRETANHKQSIIIKQNELQNKQLTKRVIKELQKLKQRLRNNYGMYQIKQEINAIFAESIENIQNFHNLSSRRITRTRSKTHINIDGQMIQNTDFDKYKFGLTQSEINLDLKYLTNEARHTHIAYDSDSDSDNGYGFVSQPMGFLNDRHELEGQLHRKSKRVTAHKSRRIIVENCDIEMENLSNGYGQKCVFEKGDSTDNITEYGNAVFVDGVRLSVGDRVRVERGECKGGVIRSVMKYHMKVESEEGRVKRMRYKDINQGLMSVFLE